MKKTFLIALVGASLSNAAISRNGRCGGSSRNTCVGSSFGDCCSQYGWCGSSGDYCNKGCNPAYGSCQNSAPSPSRSPSRTSIVVSSSRSAAPSASSKVSTNARCGNANDVFPKGMTCAGSEWGNCCSQYGYCGKSNTYCGRGCNPNFGTCNGVSQSSARSSSSSSVLKSSSQISSSHTVTSSRVSSSVASSLSTSIVSSSISSSASSSSLSASPTPTTPTTCSAAQKAGCVEALSVCACFIPKSGGAFCGQNSLFCYLQGCQTDSDCTAQYGTSDYKCSVQPGCAGRDCTDSQGNTVPCSTNACIRQIPQVCPNI